MKYGKKNQKGFSLIELLIVVAIMLVIAAIAVPAVIASNQAGNEAAAANNLRALVTAENGFHQLYGSWSGAAVDLGMGTQGAGKCPTTPVAATPAQAGPPIVPATGGSACLLPQEVALAMDAGILSNYTFTYDSTDVSGWKATAVPASPSAGRKSFYVDATGTIRYAMAPNVAAVTDKPLSQ